MQIFVCHGDLEMQWAMSMSSDYEAEHLEQVRMQDVGVAFYCSEDEPEFFSAREATDPHFPPPECVWWEECEPETISLDSVVSESVAAKKSGVCR